MCISQKPSGKKSSHRKLNRKKESNKKKEKEKYISLSRDPLHERETLYHHTTKSYTREELQIFCLKHLPLEILAKNNTL